MFFYVKIRYVGFEAEFEAIVAKWLKCRDCFDMRLQYIPARF